MAFVSRAHVLGQRIRAMERGPQILLLQRDLVKQQIGMTQLPDLVRLQEPHPIASPARGMVFLVAINRVVRPAIHDLPRVRAGIRNQRPGVTGLRGSVGDHVVQHLPRPLQDHPVPAIRVVKDRRVGQHRKQPRGMMHPRSARECRVRRIVRPIKCRMRKVSPITIRLHRNVLECLPRVSNDPAVRRACLHPS